MDLMKDKRGGLKDISVIVGMYLLIIVLIVCVIFLLKYKHELQMNPLSYGMQTFNFTSCSCFDEKGKIWIEMNGSGFIHQENSFT